MTKKQAIEQSILTIAEYFEINPKALADQRTTRGVRTQNAMAAFVYHLHACGMSYDRIGKFICKQDCRVRRYVSQGAMMMRGEHKRMIESLPKIPTTIEIVKNATMQATSSAPCKPESTNKLPADAGRLA